MSAATVSQDSELTSRVDASVPAARRPLLRLLRGPSDHPPWARPGLLALLGATALLYLWDLSASGWANAFYAAAAQSGGSSWKAWFFGSFDLGNAITVDKPPAALWVMGLSVRLFGLSSWSILVPQALMGVAAVGLLAATVRRRFGALAGLIAGAVMALTPVAVLMFRFDNPDALLVLLLVAAAYAVVRAVEVAGTRWLVLAGALVGFAFLAKMMQAFLVVPGFALVYLWAAPTTVRRRLLQLVAAGAGMVAAGAWWIAVVELWPASSRPYIGGSQANSILELTLGYNGFGRLTGNERGSVTGGGAAGGPGGGSSPWGQTGLTRLFTSEFGGQVAWLIPAALVMLVALLWISRHVPRTDAGRAQVVLWGSWLLVTGLVFSFAAGIIHPYYSVALVPAIGALVGIGSVALWRARHLVAARAALALAGAASAGLAYVLLARTPSWHPWLKEVVLVVGLLGSVVVFAGPLLGRRLLTVAAVATLVTALTGPTAYALDTASTAHNGSLPSAGPAVAGGRGMGPGGRGSFPGGGPGGGLPGGGPGQGVNRFPGGGAPAGGGGMGGLLDASTPSAQLLALLSSDASSYPWVAAAVGSQSAAGVQLASGHAVMAVGGFNGTDPSPTLAQFQALVGQHKIHYFLSGGSGMRGGGPGGMRDSGTSSEITAWVQANFTAQTVGGTTVYDLTAPTSSTSTSATGG
ncbi:MAG: glycosyltransferase family 39 protein [Motilibacteraceae bacterium]